MNMKRLAQIVVLAVVVIIAGVSILQAQSNDEQMNSIRVDVAEDGNSFVFDPSITFEDGMPAYGTSFVTNGYIYPEGTLNGSNGVLEDGSPEFPDLVLGEWTCFGSFVGEGMYTESGAMVITNQVFSFYGDEANSTIVSTGFELADIDVPVDRAITGGTGLYNGFAGTQTQSLLGFTEYMGVNLRVELHSSTPLIDNVSAMAEMNRIVVSEEQPEIYPWDSAADDLEASLAVYEDSIIYPWDQQ